MVSIFHRFIRIRHQLKRKSFVLYIFLTFLILFFIIFLLRSLFLAEQKSQTLQIAGNAFEQKISSLSGQLEELKNEDTRKTNAALKVRIDTVESAFSKVAQALEVLSDARGQGVVVNQFENDLATAVSSLQKLDYETANKQLIVLNQKITEALAQKQTQLAAAVPAAQASQALPGAGSYSRQSVKTDRGDFVVSLIAEKTASVKMITDTGNDDTCFDNCTVLPLASYVARNGGFAGINGSYFCPPDYPSCSGKVNSFNTLIFNARLKKYMNSDQNVYSTVPMVVQNADHSMRFLGASQEWGRDTGIIGGIANQPMLVSGGKALITDTGAKGPRGFVGVKGDTLYIGVVSGASIGDAAIVLQTLGIDSALNLDGGGSSALYYNGSYKVGPGRNLPNAVILAR